MLFAITAVQVDWIPSLANNALINKSVGKQLVSRHTKNKRRTRFFHAENSEQL